MALCSKGRRLLRRANAFTTMDNTQTAKKLFKSGKLRVASLPTERLAPLLKPSLDRARGMLVGLAIGDALGNTTESLNANDRRRSHGEIRDYLPNSCAGGRSWLRGFSNRCSNAAVWTWKTLPNVTPAGESSALGIPCARFWSPIAREHHFGHVGSRPQGTVRSCALQPSRHIICQERPAPC